VWDGADRVLLPELPIGEAAHSHGTDRRWKSRHWAGKAA
jgi:hypothetical protein